MAGIGGNAVACAPVPNLDGPIDAATDELRVVELKTTDSGGMAPQGAEFLSRVCIPDLDSRIIGTSGQDVVLKL